MNVTLKKRLRWLFLRLCLVAFGGFVFLLGAELLLRFLPVYSGFNLQPLNAENPYPHFRPNQTVQWSRDWNFNLANKLNVNNYGYINDQDYDPGADAPLLAVIGDSYIEAAMVPYGQTVQGRLQETAGERARVYSFSQSGAPLSLYLKWAEFARDEFSPDAYLFVVIGNDFDESLTMYRHRPVGWFYSPDDEGNLNLEMGGYEPSTLRRLARQSALVRYLVWNVNLEDRLTRMFTGNAEMSDEAFVGNVAAIVDDEVIRWSKRAVDQFFVDLPEHTGVGPAEVLFILDGMRPDLYDAAALARAEESFVAEMRRYFLAKANALGYPAIDLQPRFVDHFAAKGEPFEYPMDNHWNGLGHKIAAEAVAGSEVWKSLLAE